MREPKAILKSVVRSRWAIALISVTALALLYMTLALLRNGMPALREMRCAGSRVEVVPLSNMEAVCATNVWQGLLPAEGMASAFYTTNFIPPPPPPPKPPPPPTNTPPPAPPPQTNAPAPPPPPPAPTTKKVSLLYQGYIETAAGIKHAFVKVGDGLTIATNGTVVVADQAVLEFDLKSLVLRNPKETNILQFNVPKELEIPLK